MILSCIVPVYNKPDELKILLSSLNENCSNFELILVDDCSTDKRVHEVLKTAKHYLRPNISLSVIFNSSNMGIAENTNVGIANAKGDYIALIDADDYLHPKALDYLISKISQCNPIWGFTDRTDLHDGGLYFGVEYGNQRSLRSMHIREALLFDMVASHLKFYKKSIFQEVGLFSKEYNNVIDYDMALRLAYSTHEPLYVNDKIYCHRISPAQNTNINRLDQVKEANILRGKYLKKLPGSSGFLSAPIYLPKSYTYCDYYEPLYLIQINDGEYLSFNVYADFIDKIESLKFIKDVIVYPNGYFSKFDLLKIRNKVSESFVLLFNSNVNPYISWYQFYSSFFTDIYCFSPSEAMLMQLSGGGKVCLFQGGSDAI